MATVTGFTAERMKEIEDSAIVDGEVVGDDLILKRYDLTEINVGNVRGPQGVQGDPGVESISKVTSATRPLTPSEGDFIYETDTDFLWSYSNGAWVYRGGRFSCTSATRPATPFEGLEIYETDTKRRYIYSGTAWLYLGGGTDPTAFRAWRNASFLTVPSVSVPTKIVWDTESYDYGNCYNVANGEYAAPSAGIFSFKSKVAVTSAAAGERFIYSLFVNGVEAVRGTDAAYLTGMAHLIMQVVDEIPLAQGDDVDVRLHQTSGDARSIDEIQVSAFFTGRKVSN